MLINTGVTRNLEIILVHTVMFAKQDWGGDGTGDRNRVVVRTQVRLYP